MDIDKIQLVCKLAKDLKSTGVAQLTTDFSIIKKDGQFFLQDSLKELYNLPQTNGLNEEKAVKAALLEIHGPNSGF